MRENPDIERLDDDFYMVHGYKELYHQFTLDAVVLEELDAIISGCNVVAQAAEGGLDQADAIAVLTRLVLNARKRVEKAAAVMEEECGAIALHRRIGYVHWLDDEYLGAEFVPRGTARFTALLTHNNRKRERHETLI